MNKFLSVLLKGKEFKKSIFSSFKKFIYKDCLDLFIRLKYFFGLTLYIFNNKLVNNIIPYICRFLLISFLELLYN